MDTKKWRELAEKAKAKKTAAQFVAAISEGEKEKANRSVDKAKAQVVIVQIPSVCEEAAGRGEMSAPVMRVERWDVDRPRGEHSRICDQNWLKVVPKLVWDFCLREGLRPTLEYEDDGVGEKEWFNLVVHW